MGLKPSDFRAVPLMWDLHERLHCQGERRFWDEYELDPEWLIGLQLLRWLKEHELSRLAVKSLEELCQQEELVSGADGQITPPSLR